MISIEIFVTIGIVAALFALYGLIDYRHKFYANIAALFMSSLFFWYLSTVIGNGTVQTGSSVNSVTGEVTALALQDESLSYLLLIPAVATMIVTVYLAWDAREESKKVKLAAMEDT
jgi:hypothetical protein